jgi:pyruvate dehydrogenase E2 component (dihydrolipoamide acetyltransferase)
VPSREGTPAWEAEAPAEPSPRPTHRPPTATPARPPTDRLAATPVARRLAREHGVELGTVKGSGPAGRIVEKDILAGLEEAQVPPATGNYRVVALSNIQRKTGARLLESVRQAPYFDLETEVDMSRAIAQRTAEPGLSFTAILVHAVAQALREVPRLNAHFVADELRVYENVNVGVAMATEAGLLVPVVHRAQEKSLAEVNAALRELKEKAQAKRFALDDLSGATFTVTNLGTHGVDSFRAILNPPEVGILAVGRIAERAVVREGQVVVRPVARFTLTVDHRALDGAVAAPFLEKLL